MCSHHQCPCQELCDLSPVPHQETIVTMYCAHSARKCGCTRCTGHSTHHAAMVHPAPCPPVCSGGNGSLRGKEKVPSPLSRCPVLELRWHLALQSPCCLHWAAVRGLPWETVSSGRTRTRACPILYPEWLALSRNSVTPPYTKACQDPHHFALPCLLKLPGTTLYFLHPQDLSAV